MGGWMDGLLGDYICVKQLVDVQEHVCSVNLPCTNKIDKKKEVVLKSLKTHLFSFIFVFHIHLFCFVPYQC